MMDRMLSLKSFTNYFDRNNIDRQKQLAKFFLKIAIVILFLIPFILYFYNVIKYSVNVPYWDDYTAMDNLLSFLEIKTTLPKIKFLFRQHNEHRVVFDRIVFLAQYYVFGILNFKQLSLFGNLGWVLAVFVLIFTFHKEYDLPYFYLLPIPYILLNFVQSENMFFPMASIQFYWSILFSVLFILSLVYERIFLSIFFFLIALFTSGGGLVLFPLGILFFLYKHNVKGLGFFGTASTILIIVYFYHYESVPYHPSVYNSFVNFEQTIAYFFVYLGNFTTLYETALSFGIISSFVIIILLIRQTENLFTPLLIGYISLTAIATALTRSGFGITQALSSRYTTFSLILLVCIYFLVLTSAGKKFLKRRFFFLFLALGMGYFFGFLIKFDLRESFERQKAEKIFGIASYLNGDNSYLAHQYKEIVANILSRSIEEGIYDYKDFSYYPVEQINSKLPSTGNILSHIDYYDGYQIEGWTFILEEIASNSQISILLSDEKKVFRFDPFRVNRPDVSQAYDKRFQYDDSGFKAFLSIYKIPNGNYKIGVLVENGDKQAVNWTEYTFSASNKGDY